MHFVDKSRLITIIGTGDYGTSLGKRLLKFGFQVVYGSRRPDRSYVEENFSDSVNVEIHSIKEAWVRSNEIVFFAIHANKYDEVVKELFVNSKHDYLQQNSKIVVDISNKIEKIQERSNAEFLQSCFNHYTDKVKVVKAFNTVSAYSMCSEYTSKASDTSISYGNGQVVPIASDCSTSGETVANLANHLGFRGCTIGQLEKARQLERSNESVFADWHYATLFSILFFIFNFLWYGLNSFVTKYTNFRDFLKAFSLLKFLCSVSGLTTLSLLAFVYLAGLVASIYQLYNGTKRKRFPKYLDLWLKSRKQLGLWVFFFATFHLLTALSVITPAYLQSWFKKSTLQDPVIMRTLLSSNQTVVTDVRLSGINFEGLTLHGELNILTGFLTYLLLSLLALTSINSIASSLNWSEWNFIHTKLGYICLTLGLVHDVTMWTFTVLQYCVGKQTAYFTFTRGKFYVLWIPLIVLLLKCVFTFVKPIRKRIESIRNGVDYSNKVLIEKL